MTKNEQQLAEERFVDRVTSNSGARGLGTKHPKEGLPAVVAINDKYAEILVSDRVAVILDLDNEAIVDRGDNLALPYKYDLDFLDEEDESAIPAILAAYERAISKVAA